MDKLQYIRELKVEQERAERYRRSMMDSRLLTSTFETAQPNPTNDRAMRLCRSYAARFDDMLAKNQGLLLYGGVGTGKTFAAACIANELLERGISVVMTSFVRVLERLQRFDDAERELLDKMNAAKLLIIDDLGAERSTDYALEKVYRVVDERSRVRLPMILTTNLDLNELMSTSDVRYDRIYDRILEMCYPVRFTGQSWRKTTANKRFEAMKKFLENTESEMR